MLNALRLITVDFAVRFGLPAIALTVAVLATYIIQAATPVIGRSTAEVAQVIALIVIIAILAAWNRLLGLRTVIAIIAIVALLFDVSLMTMLNAISNWYYTVLH